jgi:hypothetical protein
VLRMLKTELGRGHPSDAPAVAVTFDESAVRW